MILFLLNGTFLLRLSPYLAVGIVLLLAILVVFRQLIPGKQQTRSGCCDAAGDHDHANLSNNMDQSTYRQVQQDLPLCGNCKGCRVMACPGQVIESGQAKSSGQGKPAGQGKPSGQAKPAGQASQACNPGNPGKPGIRLDPGPVKSRKEHDG